MQPIHVNEGIFIDLKCTCIRQVGKGVFIPTEIYLSDREKEFQEELTAFLKKWFTLVTGSRVG